MNVATQQMLNQLVNSEWFWACGRPPIEPVRTLFSWPEAIENCGSRQWKEVEIEMLNLVGDAPCQRDRARYNQWNDIANEIKKHLMPLVDRKCAAVIRENRLPKVFKDSVNWDLLGLLMECEYADLIDTNWFHVLGDWYLRGHFPCGWDGEFPQGRLIVY